MMGARASQPDLGSSLKPTIYFLLPWMVVVALAIVDLRGWFDFTQTPIAWPAPGGDLSIYREAAARWIRGGPFYETYQLTGPYNAQGSTPMPVLYPPTALPLFALFTVLPAVLWWFVPIAVITAVIVRLRPRPVCLVLILAVAAWPGTVVTIVWTGNPALWLVAAFALAVAGWRWAAPLILLKPTLLPFAFVGIRSRRWWASFAALVAISLLFAPMWPQYFNVLLNLRGGSWEYSTGQWPAMLIPALAWAGQRATHEGATT